MDNHLPTISLASLLIAFAPGALLVWIMYRWSLPAWTALYANARMLVQLLAVGFVLTYVLRTDEPAVVVAVLAGMALVAAWISLRPLGRVRARAYATALAAIAASGLSMLAIVTQLVLDLPRWFEPSFAIPLAGMILANTMNTVSLAAERFESESGRGSDPQSARARALDAALIPQINGLLAVGLVSLPGMMTGQILSGVEPLVAVRYQIVVMCMIFGSGGLGAALYLALRERGSPEPGRPA